MSVQLNPTSSCGLAQIIEASQAADEWEENSIQTTVDRKRLLLFGGLALLSLFAFLLSLSWSSVRIPLGQVLAVLIGGTVEKETWHTIVMDIRLPRVLTSIAVGIGLGLSGLQMQTLFRNPLASPFTLGVSSGASLGVAIVVIVLPVTVGYGAIGGGLLGNLGTVAGAAIGAFAVLAIMLAVAARVQEMTTVLLLGVVIGALVSAVVTVLVFFADEQRTREFVEWGFGSFHKVRWNEIPFFLSVIGIGATIAALATKYLNALLLGENYAQSMGLNLQRARLIIMTSAALMAGAVVAYAGPIGFLGIAIPHLARGLFGTSDHRILVPASIWIGVVLAWPVASSLKCRAAADAADQRRDLLFGAPVALWVLLRAAGGWL
ncbi:MAG: iron ABC transporter permease [Caldilineaceae bacterium]